MQWVLGHPELSALPKFKLKSSFKDPLTSQILEAVRIKRRGVEILKSKSDFNACRVPRLGIDLEGWKTGKNKGNYKDGSEALGRLEEEP